MSTLVIVESPTKARTIRNFLPSEYRVEASMGHVRDLPQSASDIPAELKSSEWAKLGVNVDADFEPLYIVPDDKKKIVRELKAALKGAKELILATDEDREGESISWHLLQILQPKVPIKRMVFHEITSEAIKGALKNCRQIDNRLVHAQETRRILDRLVGYTLSPLLWKKIAWGLSAGRVQSVAVRLIVNRERERRAFKSANYWDLKANLYAPKQEFPVQLVSVGGTNIATGKDFDETTGKIPKGRKVLLLDEAGAIALKERLNGKVWTVSNLEERTTSRKPSPPFTTSTMQQEANRKLRLSARDSMRVAQALYEQGYITYMRTDSVHLSQQAIAAARQCVTKMYGSNFLSKEPRQYVTKSKGAQEAHEAIRPAGETFRTPQETGLSGRELALYDLIWKRTVASQMADAQLTMLSVQLTVEDAIFRASGKRIDFAGFFRAYVEGSDDPDAALEEKEITLPPLKVGDHPVCRELNTVGHETQPPARYTEAALVKMLESEGIGRPSTYASIIGTICDRGYVQLVNNALIPTFTAFAVTNLLEEHFPNLVDPSFTSKMEQTLDDISTGSVDWLPYLKEFYSGEQGLSGQVKARDSLIDGEAARTVHLEGLDDDVKVKIGKFGAYIQVGEGDRTVNSSIPQNLTPSDLVPEKIELLLKQKLEGPDQIGIHPETNEPIFMMMGQYGPYVQLGQSTEALPKPKRASLPKGIQPEQVNLDLAVKLLALPRTLGAHPDTGNRVFVNTGRFGPYVCHVKGNGDKDDNRSLKSTDDPYTITFERAIELLAQPKTLRGTAAAKVLKSLGKHPDDDDAIEILDGKYGAYVKHGKVNVSLTKEQSVDTLTLDEALSMLATKSKSSKSTSKRTKASETTKKTATKKANTKSTVAKAATKTAVKKKTTTTKKTAATK
ncbi:MAG: type I DNA topoisomerase [Pseudanabaena sp.]|jgi:DNA topoisomerase-1|uniref:type I DNA topoisomerase n=1 Tax=Pseudanabaena mucicola TaxID=71190 RepID=UPI002575AFB3|nr:type I DNA topoisomerase [Pseudanabaena mucicola]MCA6586416.1 type I DNA topoisomerase [Pseudanabaena sp. M051S1SP1A06QC]MCA6589678.1 type I DNA topoisomerase [Pseudanabaena sp. M109S1SP1A06QC]MCA6602963.1 type I DNA topoisomerase [Pseudanabaena sp. M007S1SP1A06QC]MCA6612166.1 type I DNA topoisomerase [Pseudanabaena sp. M158S2SP1A06QC]MCA6615968.1 type I DNA topoisomerase [Pseudanabaena sp. M090S1SP1A06QC]MCE2977447.1 type I DNA topoisomerase [Pseudanabaena sp. CoA8_M7]